MRDPCQADLSRTPHVSAHAGWVWSRQNMPVHTDEKRCGKWMLFPRCGQAVPVWRVVAQVGEDGQIWLAKIALRASRGSHVICVYTRDFMDRDEVEAAVVRLDDLGLVERPVYYKPDVFTYAGLYNRTGSPNRASVYEYLPEQRHMQATPSLQYASELLTCGPWQKQ
jgi:hypothetical protein